MGFIVGGAIAGIGAIFGSKKASKNAWHARNAAQVAAWEEQVFNENQARKQQEQTQALQAQQQQFELDREASAKQQANEMAMSEQNQQVSELTPTVELNANASNEAAPGAARKRRAQFRPEYTSGVTI